MSLSPEFAADPAKETATLLRRYVNGDGTAFRDLVRRYHPLVFGAALRRAEGRRALAEDAAQLVFIDLARRAPSLKADERLGGWLHQRAVRAAATLMRGEARRHAREQCAAAAAAHAQPRPDTSAAAGVGVGLDGAAGQGFPTGLDGQRLPVFSLSENDGPIPSRDWQELAPHLDEALQRLSAADRDAVLLRCVEGRNFRAVGAALGLSDDAAQKRVSRALEKLRATLLRRLGRTSGIPISLSVIAAGLATDHARASAVSLSSEALQTSTKAMSSAGAVTIASRILPHLKAAAIGAALACTAWAWPLIKVPQPAKWAAFSRPESGTQPTARPSSAMIRYPVFPPLPKMEEGIDVTETVRRIAALAAGPYNSPVNERFWFFCKQLEQTGNAGEAMRRITAEFPLPLLQVMDQRAWTEELLKRWAQRNYTAALDHAVTHFIRSDPEFKSLRLPVVFNAILAELKNPDLPALSRWYASRMSAEPALQHGYQARSILQQAGEQLARSVLGNHSLESLQSLRSVENRLRLGLFNSLAGSAADTETLQLLASIVPELETPALRARLMTSVVERYGELDYPAARQFVEAIPDPSQRLAYAEQIAAPRTITPTATGVPLSQDARKPRTDWWLSMAPAGQHDQAAISISRIWNEHDPEWSGQWLERQLDAAVYLKFVRDRFRLLCTIPGSALDQALPELTRLSIALKRVDPQGTAALFDEMRKTHGWVDGKEKLQALMPP